MVMEYPDYYERFECIAGACTDSCCAKWEIDVDEESYYRYLTVQGPFGERVRGCLHTEVVEDEPEELENDEASGGLGESPEPHTHEEWSFPLTPDRRCPFLNDKDLCDMYTALGHESLPRTCREFPRGDACVGAYHQIDVAFACPEANRLIFEDLEHPITYVRRAEPTGIPALDRYCADFSDENLSEEDASLLEALLSERNQIIDMLQDDTLSVAERYATLFSLSAEYGYDPSEETRLDLIDRIDRMELLDERWSHVYDPVKRALDTGFPSAQVLEGIVEAEIAERELLRFLVYLVFRYYIDGYFEGSLTGVYRLMLRGFHMMRLLLAALSPEDFNNPDARRDLYHIWSRQVEHSPENFYLMKEE